MKATASVSYTHLDVYKRQLAGFAILNIAEELLRDTRMGFAFETYRNELAMVVSCATLRGLEELLADIYHSILDFIEIPVDFAVSEEGTLAKLPELDVYKRQDRDAEGDR